MTAKRIILDTDIGTDVDDCLALAVILGSPELALEAVTTVYGDVLLRARMVMKLLELRGTRGVPVVPGATRPLLGKRPVYWAGHEGRGLLASEDDARYRPEGHAIDLIVRTAMAAPGEITLLAIGPLTNVALAFLREPKLAQSLAGLVLMGGVVGGAHALHLPWVEHNIRCDPEAAHIVFSAGMPITVVPLDVTTRVVIRPEGVAQVRARGTPYHEAIAEQVDLYPPFATRGWTNLHDPLTAALLVDPSLMSLVPVRLVIETQGEHTAGMMLVGKPDLGAPANAQIALDVDVPRAERFIVERVAS